MTMLKHIIISLLVIISCCNYATSQDTSSIFRNSRIEDLKGYERIADTFIYLPQEINQINSNDSRIPMVEYYALADSTVETFNYLGGVSRIKKMTKDFIDVKVSDASSIAIRLLTQDDKRFAVVSHTVYGPAGDSEIYFIEEDEILDGGKYFKAPELKDFFIIPKGSKIKMSEIEDMIDFVTIEYRLNESDYSLRAILTIGEHIDKDNYNKIKPFIREEIVYHWNGKKYIKEKNKQ